MIGVLNTPNRLYKRYYTKEYLVSSLQYIEAVDNRSKTEHNNQMKFLHPTIVVDVVIFTIDEGVLKTLLITRAREPFAGSPALPGGFLHEGETTKSAAERILCEKAGVEGVYLEQLYTFDDPKRDPRGALFSVTYFALVPKGEVKIDADEGTQTPRFVPVMDMPKLAFDHGKILSYAIERLRAKVEYTNVTYSFLPKLFTLTGLQKIYEAVFDKHMDKRNFRKKFKDLGLIEETNQFSKGGRQRPAKLYKFTSKRPSQLKKFF